VAVVSAILSAASETLPTLPLRSFVETLISSTPLWTVSVAVRVALAVSRITPRRSWNDLDIVERSVLMLVHGTYLRDPRVRVTCSSFQFFRLFYERQDSLEFLPGPILQLALDMTARRNRAISCSGLRASSVGLPAFLLGAGLSFCVSGVSTS